MGGRKIDALLITRAATEMIDEGGLTALSMRKLATRLDVPVMNLYYYVSTRDEVLDRVAEAAFADLEPSNAGGQTLDRLAALYRTLYDELVRHPGLAALFADRALSGPAVYAAADRVLSELLDAGLTEEDSVDGFTALLSYTIGSAQFAIARTRQSSAESENRYQTRLAGIDASALPALASVRDLLSERGTPEQFDYGLLRLLRSIIE